MKTFKTLTELDILKAAHTTILDKWAKEKNRIEENPDKEMPIAKHWEAKYWEQDQELHARILELEGKMKPQR